MYFEVKRWRLKGCIFRLMWRKWRSRGFGLRLRGAGGGWGYSLGLRGVV